MASYLIQAAYTSQALAALSKTPANREETARALIEKMGGRLTSFFYCFGDYDVVGVFEAPDETTAAAISLALNAPGHLKALKTTPLLTTVQAMEAFHKAGTGNYQAPK